MHDVADTIVAPASAAGGAARAVVRITGPGAVECAMRFFVAQTGDPSAIVAASSFVGRLTLPQFAVDVPATAFIWPGARSYTRQPTVELQLPGAAPIVDAAVAAACRHGARLAAPGEFTLRAFLAGRLDLTQAEAVLGVVEAADRRRLDEALRQLAGGLSAPLAKLRNDLLDATAHLEAGLDFVEEDIEFIERDALLRTIDSARELIEGLVRRMQARRSSADVVRIVLCGRPNVGKSSLFNALVKSDRALVAPIAGTTRDYVTARLSIGGVDCELIDTAGFEQAEGTTIAAAAQFASAERVAAGDLELRCSDDSPDGDDMDRDSSRADTSSRRVIQVRTKCDLGEPDGAGVDRLSVSARTGAGLEALRAVLAAAVAEIVSGDVVPSTAVRCRDGLSRAAAALDEARQLTVEAAGDELTSAALRGALDELGQVVGAVYTDDVLDRIFSRFCIGK